MSRILLIWDELTKQPVEIPIDRRIKVINGLPKTPLNYERNEEGDWESSLPFDSVLEVDLSDTGDLVDIPESTFADLKELEVVKLNPRTRSIGDSAFVGCSRLASIAIPSKVSTIGADAFAYSGLMSVSIPGVASIGEGTFNSCCDLTSVVMARGITSIGRNAFAFCSKLQTISIPDTVTSIEESAFCCCSSLTSVKIPDGVTRIADSVFSDCYALLSIGIPKGVVIIGSSAFFWCSSLKSIDIPNGVTSIGQAAFSRCSSLMSINIPPGVTSIGACAFNECSSLTSIRIPSRVTSIAESTFGDCSELMGVEIPSELNLIGRDAFSECSLEVVLLGGPSLLTLEGLPIARRFVAAWLDNQSRSNSSAVPTVALAGAVVHGKMVCAPVEDDWRFLGSLEICPLAE